MLKPRLKDTSLSYCGRLSELVLKQNTRGRSGKNFESLDAGSTLNNLAIIRYLMMKNAPAATLEIGMSFGLSTLAIAASHRDLGRVPSQQHVAIDPFQNGCWDSCGILHLEQAGLAPFCAVELDWSSIVLPRILSEKRAMDFIYVDGSHAFADVFVDMFYCSQILSPGGLLLFDDSTRRDVAKVLRFIRCNMKSYLEEYPLEDCYRSEWRDRSLYRLARSAARMQLSCFRRTKVSLRFDEISVRYP